MLLDKPTYTRIYTNLRHLLAVCNLLYWKMLGASAAEVKYIPLVDYRQTNMINIR